MARTRVFSEGARNNLNVLGSSQLFGDFLVFRAQEDVSIVGWELSVSRQHGETLLGNDGVIDVYLELGFLSTVMSPGNLAQVVHTEFWNTAPAFGGMVNGYVLTWLPEDKIFTMRDGESVEAFYGAYNTSAAARTRELFGRVFYIKAK